MIDIHCHILHDCDDGAKNEEMSIQMAKCALEDEVRTIIATPHFYSGIYEVNFNQVEMRVDALNECLKNSGISIKILPGQEVFLARNTVELFKSGIINGLNKSRYMLVELPFDKMPEYALDMVYELRVEGVVPILAHPERYAYINENITRINSFIEEGCLLQVNSHSFSGLFGKTVRYTAMKLVKSGVCNFIASDAHTDRSRKPEINKLITEYLGNDVELLESVSKNGVRLINNEEISSQGLFVKEKRSIFDFLRK